MKSAIAHALINEDPAFRTAHATLHYALHDPGPSMEQIATNRTERMRRALEIKIRHALLLSAFREPDGAQDISFRKLAAHAKSLLENPSWTMSVAEFVYRAYGVEGNAEVHPPMDIVERETLVSAEKIVRVLTGKKPKKAV